MNPISNSLFFDISIDNGISKHPVPTDRKIYSFIKNHSFRTLISSSPTDSTVDLKKSFITDEDKGKPIEIALGDLYKFGGYQHVLTINFSNKDFLRLTHLAHIFKNRLKNEPAYFQVMIPIKEEERESFYSCAEAGFYLSLRDMNVAEALYFALVMNQLDETNYQTKMAMARLYFIIFRMADDAEAGLKASEHIKEALTIEPEDLPAKHLLAHLLFFQRKYEECFTLAESLLKHNSSDPTSFGLMLRLHPLFEHSRPHLDRILSQLHEQIYTIQRTQPNILLAKASCSRLQYKIDYTRALIKFNEKDFESVLTRIEKLQKIEPDDIQTIALRLRALNHLKRTTETARIAKKYKSIALVQALYHIGKREYHAAHVCYKIYFDEMITVEYPLWMVLDLIDIWKSKAPIFSKDSSLIHRILVEMVQSNPDSLLFWETLYDVSCFKKDFDMIEKSVRQCIVLNPPSKFDYFSDYARILFKAGKPSEVKLIIYELMQDLWNGPPNASIFLLFCELLNTINMQNTALEFFYHHFHLTLNQESFRILCLLYEEMGMLAELKDLAESYLEINPQSSDGHYYLAIGLEHYRQYEEAMVHVMQVSDVILNPLAYCVKIRCHYALGDYEKVVENAIPFEREIKKDQASQNVYLSVVHLIIRSQIALGNEKASKKLYLKHKKTFSDDLQKEFADSFSRQNTEHAKIEQPSVSPGQQAITTPQSQISPPVPHEPKTVPSEQTESLIRNKPPKTKIHLQRFKGNVVQLDKTLTLTRKVECTLDEEIYGKIIKETRVKKTKKMTVVTIELPLSQKEFERLEIARYSLMRVGDLLKQVKELGTHSYLYPRAIMYNMLKFAEALSPTSLNRKDISGSFAATIQTHIISQKLIMSIRNYLRHHYHLIDIELMKDFCVKLVDSTVMQNLVIYKGTKDNKVTFATRTTLPKKQKLLKNENVDYLQMVQMELKEMGAIGNKLNAKDIDSNSFYKEGLKMAICNVEECIKRLQIPVDKLKEIIYFGNLIGHQMGEDPTLYVNEEIPMNQFYTILMKSDRIRETILQLHHAAHFPKI